jgi:selenocysteine lyase/cysteine desulfurase
MDEERVHISACASAWKRPARARAGHHVLGNRTQRTVQHMHGIVRICGRRGHFADAFRAWHLRVVGLRVPSGSLEHSHVRAPWVALHLFWPRSIRFSFSRYNTDADVDHVLEVMPGIIGICAASAVTAAGSAAGMTRATGNG